MRVTQVFTKIRLVYLESLIYVMKTTPVTTVRHATRGLTLIAVIDISKTTPGGEIQMSQIVYEKCCEVLFVYNIFVNCPNILTFSQNMAE